MSGKVGLSAAGRKLLARLRVPQDIKEISLAGVSPELLDEMLRQGLLEAQMDTVSPVDYQDTYSGWKSQRGMIIDHARTTAFQNAINAVVRPGDRVIDVGTGSGVLAMMAARQGASAVWGLELTSMAEWAARIAARNDLSAVQIVRGDAATFQADGPVDVIISEFAGMYLTDEWRHYAAFVQVRDRNLRPGGTVIPRAGRMFLSAVDSRKLYMDRGYAAWEAPLFGLDFSDVLESEIASPQRYIVSADHHAIVCTREIASFDFLNGSLEDYLFTTEVEFDYPAAGSFHGLVGHFELDMAPGLVLGTGTGTRETHWHQSYFPLPMMQVKAGERVAVRVRSFLDQQKGIMCLGVTVAGPGASLDGQAGQQEHIFGIE